MINVKYLWAKMESRYGSSSIDKKSSFLMVLIGKFLSRIGIMDYHKFMNYFITTIGYSIYVPFEIGGNEWSHYEQLKICIHEHQHIVQMKRDGVIKYNLGYLLSKEKRYLYELEAYATGIQLDKIFGNESNIPYVAKLLEGYALGDYIERMEKDLLKAKESSDEYEVVKYFREISA